MKVGSIRNTKAIKTKMGTYAVNIYGWLICKLTVPQRTKREKRTYNIYSRSIAY